jgi:hypothetical protein
MWLVSGLIIGLAIYITKDATPLWTLVISGLVNVDFMNTAKEIKNNQ